MNREEFKEKYVEYKTKRYAKNMRDSFDAHHVVKVENDILYNSHKNCILLSKDERYPEELLDYPEYQKWIQQQIQKNHLELDKMSEEEFAKALKSIKKELKEMAGKEEKSLEAILKSIS